jgi:hypothetical protein
LNNQNRWKCQSSKMKKNLRAKVRPKLRKWNSISKNQIFTMLTEKNSRMKSKKMKRSCQHRGKSTAWSIICRH